MKTNQLFLGIILSISISFCTKNKEIKKPLTKNETNKVAINEKEPCAFDSTIGLYLSKLSDVEKMYALRKKMISGDTLAYYEMKDIYFLSGRSDGFVPMALIMANKASFPQAYFDVYESLHSIDNNYF